MAFIDIHGHYAWDIDDGMPSLEDAKKALEKAKNNRISTIVATPHVVSGKHTLKDLEKILLEKYNLVLMPGYIEKGVSKNGEKIDLSNTNIAEEYPDLAKDINQLERLYMRPKQYNSKEWFDKILHWFAPKGQDVLEVYATDPKTGEKTQIKSYNELQVWSANHSE